MAEERIGKLNQRVTIERDYGTSQNDFGERVADWQTLKQKWAEIRGIAAAEIEEQGGRKTLRRYRVRLRFDAELLSTDRIRWIEGTALRYLDMSGLIDPDGRREWLFGDCAEHLEAS